MSTNTMKKDEFSNLLDLLPPFFTISLLMNTESFNEFRDKLRITEVEQLTLDDQKAKPYILLALGFMYKNKDVTSIFYKIIQKTDPSISFSENVFSNGIDMVINKLLGLNPSVATQSGGAKLIEYITIIGQLILIFSVDYYYLIVYHKDVKTVIEFEEQLVNIWSSLKNGCQIEEGTTSSSLQRVLRVGTKNPAAVDAFFNIKECILNPYVRNVAAERYFEYYARQAEETVNAQLVEQIAGLEQYGFLPSPSSTRVTTGSTELRTDNALVPYNEMNSVVPYLKTYLKPERGLEEDFSKKLVTLSQMSPEQLRSFFNSNTPTTIPTPTAFPSTTETVPTPPPFVSDLWVVASEAINYFSPSSSISDSFYYTLVDIFKDARRKLEDAQKEGQRTAEDLFTIAERIYRNIMNAIGILKYLAGLNAYALGLIILLYKKLTGKMISPLSTGDSSPNRKAFRMIERGGYNRRKTRKIYKGRKMRKTSRNSKKRRSVIRRRNSSRK